jgi:hypothetical protein
MGLDLSRLLPAENEIAAIKAIHQELNKSDPNETKGRKAEHESH